MNILVIGGLGYIGRNITKVISEKYGGNIFVIDKLGTENQQIKEYLSNNILDFYNLDITDSQNINKITEILDKNKIDIVINLVALKSITESFKKPFEYYETNVVGLINIAQAFSNSNCENIVFASSAAVYGECNGEVEELTRVLPVSPYGNTKLIGEMILKDFASSTNKNYLVLRLFNIVGVADVNLIEKTGSNILPLLMHKSSNSEIFTIFGNTFSTFDGTATRDYVDVRDLAEFIYFSWEKGFSKFKLLNFGTGVGTTVKQIVDLFNQYSKNEIKYKIDSQREGEPEKLIANLKKFNESYDYKFCYKIEDSIKSLF